MPTQISDMTAAGQMETAAPPVKQEYKVGHALKRSNLTHSWSTASGRSSSSQSDVSRISTEESVPVLGTFAGQSSFGAELKCVRSEGNYSGGENTSLGSLPNQLESGIICEGDVEADLWDDCGPSSGPPRPGNFFRNTGSRVWQPLSSSVTTSDGPHPHVSDYNSCSHDDGFGGTLISPRGDYTEEEQLMIDILSQQVTRGLSCQPAPRGDGHFKGQKQGLRIKYNHYENPAIFVSILIELLTRRPIGTSPHHTIFAKQATDPILECAYLVDRLASGMRCKYPCYVLALLYVIKLNNLSLPTTCDTFQRLACAAIVVAVKFYDDLYYSNEHYASELGFPLETLNKLELSFLLLLDFDLKVSTKDFNEAMSHFDDFRRNRCNGQGLMVWCGLRTAEMSSNLVQLSSLFNVLGTDKASRALRLESHVSSALEKHLKGREQAGCRFETEEENLHKSAVMSQMKDIKKLFNQFHNSRASILKSKDHNHKYGSHGQQQQQPHPQQRSVPIQNEREPSQSKAWQQPASRPQQQLVPQPPQHPQMQQHATASCRSNVHGTGWNGYGSTTRFTPGSNPR